RGKLRLSSTTITQLQIDSVVDLLKATPRRIASVTRGLSDAVLKRRPGEDAWSVAEILAHLRACSDVWGDSILRMIANDNPTLRYLSPRTWIRKTDYIGLDFQSSFSAFRKQRIELLKQLVALQSKDWSRGATFLRNKQEMTGDVYSYATRMAEHESRHCGQIEGAL